MKFGIAGAAELTDASPPSRAAWIEIAPEHAVFVDKESPPSRAAWIEIRIGLCRPRRMESPPSRAAWIEIAIIKPKIAAVMVAAFTGGVD